MYQNKIHLSFYQHSKKSNLTLVKNVAKRRRKIVTLMNVRKIPRGTMRVQAPPPKHGGTRGYSPEFREQAVHLVYNVHQSDVIS